MPRWTRVVLVVVLMGAVWTVAGARAPAVTPATPRGDRQPFAWVRPTSPPASWRPLVPPSGVATLWSPPSFVTLPGDPGSATAGRKDAKGVYRAYLNTTPRQGAEQLRGFAAFRVHLIGEDHDVSVHQEAAAEHLAFRGGEGSCVIDRYVTRVGHHRYREIACLVVGVTGRGAVVVAASALQDWARYRPILRIAVASFSVA